MKNLTTTLRRLCVLYVLLLGGGCRDDERVWITTGRDSLSLIQRVTGEVDREDAKGDMRAPTAISVPRSALAAISEAQHEEHHRCGGFMLHDSEAEAREALHPAQRALRVAPAYTLDNRATVEALLPAASEPNVLATIRELSAFRTRFHGSPSGEEAALHVRDGWQALAAGRSDIEVALIEHQRTPQSSVKMTIRGTRWPEERVVLGGHLDSIVLRGDSNSAAPGADDNASGIATLTEIARTAVALDYRPERTVVFYGYAAEEIGLVGSAEIAARAKADELEVVGVMQVDMTNYTASRKAYIALVRDFTSPALTRFASELIDTYLDVPYQLFDCGYACSDHASWTKNGFPSVYPHEAVSGESNGRIHTVDDTLARSDDRATHSMHFVRFGLAFMAELAKGELAPDAADAGAPLDATVDAGADGSTLTDGGDAAPDAPHVDAGPPEEEPMKEPVEQPVEQPEQAAGVSPVRPDAGGCRVVGLESVSQDCWIALLALLRRRRTRG